MSVRLLSLLRLCVALASWVSACGVLADTNLAPAQAPAPSSPWAHISTDGKLVYKALPRGDRIMDFSFAGYMGGGVAIPFVPVQVTLAPVNGDASQLIQEAIDLVARLPVTNRFRGAVLLKPGTYNCSQTLRITSDGIVLRGSGSGPQGTTISMSGTPHLAILISGHSSVEQLGRSAKLQDLYVPAGATSLTVEEAAQFSAGDTVLVLRPVTEAWVHFMGMDGLYRNGRKETWLSPGSQTTTERHITQVQGSHLTLDIPLSDSFDAKLLCPPGASVVKVAASGRLSQAGVESLRIIAPPQPVAITERHHQAIRLRDVSDAWVRDIDIADTINSVGLGRGSQRITVADVRVTHSVATKGAAKPADFSTDDSQNLFLRCSSTGSNLFYFVTGARVAGPNVLLDCVFHGNGRIQPHARWATGLLVDNCQVPDGGIDFMNRGEMGSGHGWTSGWCVAWNCTAHSFVIQQPPGAMNWAIGCRGSRDQLGMPFGHQPALAEGIFDSHGTAVALRSLYLAQLAQRLGPRATGPSQPELVVPRRSRSKRPS